MVALALALLSYVRVSADGLTYRNPEVWSNESTLLLSDAIDSEWRRSSRPLSTEPLLGLVDTYAEIATGDVVIGSLKKQGMLRRRGEKSGVAGIPRPPWPLPSTAQFFHPEAQRHCGLPR